MNSYVRALLGLGSAGAAANARRACEGRRGAVEAVEVRLQQILGGRADKGGAPRDTDGWGDQVRLGRSA